MPPELSVEEKIMECNKHEHTRKGIEPTREKTT